jgi:GH25 family lysozyme M1 (1,4-beta-N-acetylmuramidase)
MTTYGVDVRHHQEEVDWPAFKRDGIEFAFIKATEGDLFVDDRFETNLFQASAAGMVVAAYHYQRSVISAAAQVANILSVVPKWCPVVIDVEANSGIIALTREIVARLNAAGYRTPLLYLPRWYWQQVGSPSLAGLPPLWSSRYPDDTVNDYRTEWTQTPTSYWTGYGGLPVAVLQFTSSARIAGRAPLDANAYQGTLAGLNALLGYTSVTTEEDDMSNVRLMKGDAAEQVYAVKLDPEQKTAEGEPTVALRCYVPPTIGPALMAAFGPVATVGQASFDAIAKVEGSA